MATLPKNQRPKMELVKVTGIVGKPGRPCIPQCGPDCQPACMPA